MPRAMSASLQRRARYARTPTPGGLLYNAPAGAGIPSGQEPVSTVWYWGSDSPAWFTTPQASLAAVTRAESLLVNTISSAPWPVLSGASDPRLGVITLPAPRWLNDPMLARPDDRIGRPTAPAALRMTRSAFWSQWIRSVIRQGMGYLLFEEGADGQPVAGTLKVLNPQWVAPTDEDGYVARRIGDPRGEYVKTDYDGRLTLGSRSYRLVEISNPLATVDEFGITPSILTMHARELGLAESSVTYAQSATRSGVPSGILQVSSPTYTRAQADQLRADWLEHHGGDSRSIAVLNSSVSFQPLSWSPEAMALVDQRRMSLLDIANAFGVPVYLLGGETGGMNYTNAESRSLDFRQYSLLTWATMVEDALSALLPAGQYVEADFRGLARADTAGRVAYYAAGLAGKWLTPGEVRTFESLPPIDTSGTPVPIARDEPPAPEADPPTSEVDL